MKRVIWFLFLGLVMLSACEKNPTQEEDWTRFEGFTKEDVVGHYEANPDESCYPEYPTEGIVFYKNAVLDITDLSGNLVSLRIHIPNVTNKVYTGVVGVEQNTFEIILADHGNGDDILMTVYKNKENQIRLRGRDRHCKTQDNMAVDCDFKGFDVVKKTEVRSKK